MSLNVYSNFNPVCRIIHDLHIYFVVRGIFFSLLLPSSSSSSLQFIMSKGLTCTSDPFVQARLEKSYRIKKICGDIFVIKSLHFFFFFLYRYLTVRTCSSVLLSSGNVEERTLPATEVPYEALVVLVEHERADPLHARCRSSSSRVRVERAQKQREFRKKIAACTQRAYLHVSLDISIPRYVYFSKNHLPSIHSSVNDG